MTKIKFDTNYRVPENIDAIALYVIIPRKLLIEAVPDFSYRAPIDLQILISILEKSEYEPYSIPL